MRSKYFLIAAGVFLIAVVLLASTLLVLAVGLTITFDSPGTEPEITFRTALDNEGETVTLGTVGAGETGNGIDDVLYQTPSGAWRREIYIEFEPEDCSAITSMEMDVSYDRTNPQYGIGLTVGILGTPNRQFNRTISGQPTNTWFTYAVSNFQSVANPSLITVRLILSTSGTNSNSPTSLLDLRLDNVKYTCSNDPTPTATNTPTLTPTPSATPTETPEPLFRPLAEFDERTDLETGGPYTYDHLGILDPDYFIGNFLNYFFQDWPTVVSLSNTTTANVFAAADGRISAVTQLTTERCLQAVNPTLYYDNTIIRDALDGRCYFLLPSPATGEIDDLYFINTVNAYVVQLEFEGGYLEYLVSSPKVKVGDTIQGGCIIGEVLGLISIFPDELSQIGLELGVVEIGLNSTTQTNGVTFLTQINSEGVSDIIFPRLLLYSTLSQACNAVSSDCMGDSQITDPNVWSEYPVGSAEWLQPGAIIRPGGRIWQEMALSSEVTYSLTVFATIAIPGSGTPEIMLQIGNTTESFTLSGGDLTQQFQILPDNHTPDLGTYYSVAIQNNSSAHIQVFSVCLTEGEASTVSGCYFNNPSFDFGTSGWDISSGVGTLGDVGSVTLPDEDSISQDVTLYPNDIGPQMYTMTVLAALNQTPSYTLSDDNFTDYVQIDVEWPESTNAYMTGPSSNDRAYFGEFAAAPDKQIQFQIIFTVSSGTTDPMVITALINGGGSGIRGLKILEACIHGPFFDEEGNVIDPGDPPTGECAVISRPTDESLSSWISWLWSKQYRFFKCELMVVLNNIRLNVANTYVTVAWQFRYLMSLLLMGSDWLSTDLFPWFNGHFANIANGRVTVVSGGPNIFDVLLAIINQVVSPIVNLIVSIVGQAAALLLQVITLIIAFLFTVLMQIFVLFDLARMLLLAIIEAWNNATPTPIPGAPDCIDPQSSAICMGIWVLDNTIFSGTGAAIIPIMIAIGSIHLLIWVVYELKKTIVEVGATS